MMKRVVWAPVILGLVLTGLSLSATEAIVTQQPSKYKNIQVLKGMTDQEIMEVMQTWAKALGVKCLHCHIQGDFAAEDRPEKQTARKMVQMVTSLNKDFFTGERKANCFLCHHGSPNIPMEPAP